MTVMMIDIIEITSAAVAFLFARRASVAVRLIKSISSAEGDIVFAPIRIARTGVLYGPSPLSPNGWRPETNPGVDLAVVAGT
jgi:hypothetical protein